LSIEHVSVSFGPLTPNRAVATDGFVTDNVADIEAPPYDAVIVTGIVPPTARVPTTNVELDEPAATVTLAGIVAGSPPVRVTTAPPVGAADVSVTVPVTESPPTTDEALNENAARAADCAGGCVVGGVVVDGGVDGEVGEPPQRALMMAAKATASRVPVDVLGRR
jgi:hypothetical protein